MAASLVPKTGHYFSARCSEAGTGGPLRRMPPFIAPATETDYIHAMTKFTPIESEFATSEEAEAHDAWVRAKVEKALASKKPGIPHDEVMAKAQAVIDKYK